MQQVKSIVDAGDIFVFFYDLIMFFSTTNTFQKNPRKEYICCYASPLSESGGDKSSTKNNRRKDDSKEMTYLELDLTLDDDEDKEEDYDSDIISGMRPKHSMNE